ncbi:hypothetical protein [Streptomyces odonnellii]|uniref:hypothetical protein n=1 Tax=Streptomyces odonnellii TaxID=1417980 RepID=UPI0006254CC7|nr:hypothetical protein [Streptomyces odonnellii]
MSLRGAVTASDHATREQHLCAAYEFVAGLQNETGQARPVDPSCRPYHSRPFLVLRADRFARALAETVTDPVLRDLPLSGSVDQWADSTDLLGQPRLLRAVVGALPRPVS